MTNTNPRTGIRYGVISGNTLDPDVLNELFYGSEAVNVSEIAAYDYAKEEAKGAYERLIEEADISAAESGEDRQPDFDRERSQEMWFDLHGHEYDEERFIEIQLERFSDNCQIDEPLIEGTYEGVKYAINWLGGAPLVYAVEGPMTYVRSLCSPCVPGAADLDSGFDPNGYLTYTVPQDWVYMHHDLQLFHAGPDQVVDGPV